MKNINKNLISYLAIIVFSVTTMYAVYFSFEIIEVMYVLLRLNDKISSLTAILVSLFIFLTAFMIGKLLSDLVAYILKKIIILK